MRRAPWTLAALLAIACAGCDTGVATHELAGATMGTSYSVKAVGAALDAGLLKQQIDAALVAVNDAMSTWQAESELSRFNAQASTDWVSVSRGLCAVVEQAQRLSELSSGAFDVTVGPAVNLWGFGPAGAAVEPPADAELEGAMARVGYPKLSVDCGAPALRKARADVYVDLSAIAKGYAVDRVADVLDAAGATGYLVEVGGEMRLKGTKPGGAPWAVAIETPQRAGRAVQSILELSDVAVATSGDYRNYFEHDGEFYSHTIDPRTGGPVRHSLASVTVVAETATLADGMATAMLVLGPGDGLALAERENIAAYFLTRSDDGFSAQTSTRFDTQVALR